MYTTLITENIIVHRQQKKQIAFVYIYIYSYIYISENKTFIKVV